MLIDPNDIVLSGAVLFGIGFVLGCLWDHIWSKQPRDSRGRFVKR
jgi:hypothetical protein